MWSSMVVVLPPVLNDDACFVQGREFLAVQTFVPEPAVEALHVAVLPGTSWFDVRRSHVDRFEELADTRRAMNSGPLSLRMNDGNATDRASQPSAHL